MKIEKDRKKIKTQPDLIVGALIQTHMYVLILYSIVLGANYLLGLFLTPEGGEGGRRVILNVI